MRTTILILLFSLSTLLMLKAYGYGKKGSTEVNIDKIKVESAVMVSFHLK